MCAQLIVVFENFSFTKISTRKRKIKQPKIDTRIKCRTPRRTDFFLPSPYDARSHEMICLCGKNESADKRDGLCVCVLFNGRKTDLKCRQTIPITHYYRPPNVRQLSCRRSAPRVIPPFDTKFSRALTIHMWMEETPALVASCCVFDFGWPCCFAAVPCAACCRLRLVLGFVFVAEDRQRNAICWVTFSLGVCILSLAAALGRPPQ